MGKSFDDILKEGKSRASSGTVSIAREWRHRINVTMNALDGLNSVYDDNARKHHISVEYCKCKKCKTVSYLIVVRDITQLDRIITFHKSGWKSIDENTYFCEKCV